MSTQPAEMSTQIEQAINRLAQKMTTRTKTLATESIVDIASTDHVTALRTLAIPPSQPTDLDAVMQAAESIYAHRVRNEHPRFFGFIPSPVLPVAWLGDVVNAAVNTHAGSWYQSSGPSAVEDELLAWLGGRVGFPSSSGGVFTSGGSMANLSAIVVARDQRLSLEHRATGVVYISDQTHSSIAKATRILGFHPSQLRSIPADNHFQMSTPALAAAITSDLAEGLHPFLIVASCGTTNVGAIDPIAAIASIASTHNIWLHVDGAYGATAALSTSHAHLTSQLRHADSLSWDAHKWLFQTYACGMLLVREKKHLVQSFATSAEYTQDALQEAEVNPNFWNLGVELTRPSRAMKLWFTLQVLGLEEVGRMIDHGFLLAERAEREIRALGGRWEVVSPAHMAIVCFRFVPSGKTERECDELNTKISREAVRWNVAAALTTKIRGVTVLRMCSISPELGVEEMAAIVARLDQVAAMVLEEMDDRAGSVVTAVQNDL